MKKIVDFFPYFDPTGKEILELRINMLKDYVDEFIICESNKTQSGIPIEYNLRKRIKELNLPEEKIKIIDLNIPENQKNSNNTPLAFLGGTRKLSKRSNLSRHKNTLRKKQ